MRTPKFPITFVAILAALLLAFPAVGLAGEKGDQEYEPPPEEQQEQQQEEQERERERQKEREQREKEMREQQAQQRERPAPAQARQMTTVTVSVPTVEAQELTSQPRQYFGELVQVSAQVEETHGQHLFTLKPEQQAGVRTDMPGAQNLVVVIPRQADIPKNEKLEIVGHVRPLIWTEFERDFVWFNMDLFQQYQQELEQAGVVRTDQPEMSPEIRPVLIATSIKTEDGEELLKQQGTERQPKPGESDE